MTQQPITLPRDLVEQVLDAMTAAHDESLDGRHFSGRQILLIHAAVLYQALSQASEVEPQLKKTHPLDIPLEVFLADLPTRPRRIINAEMSYFNHSGDESIKPPFTVRHLMMFSRSEIRKWPNMGKKSLNEIEEWLRNLGLQLWENHDERSLKLLRDHPSYYPTSADHGITGESNDLVA